MISRTKRWRRARALDARDWTTLVHATLLLASARLALRLVSPSRVVTWATAGVTATPLPGPRRQWRIRRTARLVAMASRWHVAPMTCLPQSLVVARLLRGHGIATTVRFGARIENGRLAAHAWTECDGRVVTGTPDSVVDFQALQPVVHHMEDTAIAASVERSRG